MSFGTRKRERDMDHRNWSPVDTRGPGTPPGRPPPRGGSRPLFIPHMTDITYTFVIILVDFESTTNRGTQTFRLVIVTIIMGGSVFEGKMFKIR